MKRKFSLPSIYVILFIIIFLLIIVSQIWSQLGGNIKPLGLFDALFFPIKAIEKAGDLVVFLFSIGGFLAIIINSKALDASIFSLLKRFKNREVLLIPIFIVLFSFLGTTMGFGEETIPFYTIIIPVFLAAGFDIMTAIFVLLFGAGIGVLASTVNPFTILIAFSEAGHNQFTDGLLWRIICYVVLVSFTIFFVTRYAVNARKSNQLPENIKEMIFYKHEFKVNDEITPMTSKRKYVNIIFAITFIIMLLGLIQWETIGITFFKEWLPKHTKLLSGGPISHFGEWGFLDLAFLFFVSSFFCALVDWRGEEAYVTTFLQGAKDMLGLASIILISSSIGIILEETKLREVLAGSIKSFSGMNFSLLLILYFGLFFIISFLIPSSSGFAKVIFSFLTTASLGSTLSGVVLTFSFANGLLNLISPTSFILVAALTVSKISYEKYLRAAWKYHVFLVIILITLLLIGSFMPSKTVF